MHLKRVIELGTNELTRKVNSDEEFSTVSTEDKNDSESEFQSLIVCECVLGSGGGGRGVLTEDKNGF